MNPRTLLIGFIASLLLGGAGYALYDLGLQRGTRSAAAPATAAIGGASPPSAATEGLPQTIAQGEEATRRHIASGIKAGDIDPATGTKVLHYQDPMAPGQKFEQPGKSPFMDMMLVPVYADSSPDAGTLTISSRIQQSLGVRTAPVVEGTLAPQVAVVGSIAFNERDQAVVQVRSGGFVERVYVRATLDRVASGQPLAELYVPEWIAAQEEFLSVRRMQGTDLAPLVDGARQRMRQVGMSDTQIALVEGSGRTQPRITLTAPIGGVVTELMVREGMTVMAGATLLRINGLSTVWANAEVPESQAALLRPGTAVRVQSAAFPGATFDGKVQALLPEINATTRTLKARIELANPGGRLAPGMYVKVVFAPMRADKVLLVPTEAVIQTGQRAIVMLAEDSGRFRPVEVEAGIDSGGQTEIRRGLKPGQRVVVSGQFLVDSEARLKGIEMLPATADGATPRPAGGPAADHSGHAAPSGSKP